MHQPTRRAATLALCLAAIALPLSSMAQPANPAAFRLRGTIVSATAASVTVKDRSSPEVIEMAITDATEVIEVYPIALADIRAGSFIGTAALPQADGSLRAIAITVFPESARGRGEGHRPFDLQPSSTMTNATVADVMAAPSGQTLRVKYNGGEKTIVVPPDAPVITFRPGDRGLLVPGASVSVMAAEVNGKPTALRINAGKNGFVLPY
ncbi:hypothetical protein [Variovorax terrae]|uniref:DUF5666 domain-containing protein n=1 Tax=Variovorax terrae TaxID=2923278 RepID=A0A9X2AM63_9BURK|nr:hypothetical protein [Variovorax terrae]MCJ0762964.1 hypothetical protein [Variovorax terrae]